MDRACRIGDPRHTSLQGRAEKAKSPAKSRFRNLYGMLNEERLQDGWRDSRQEAAYGVDEVSAHAYEPHLEAHIRPLVERLKRKSYRAKRVRRHDIPKANGQLRPWGIPAVEDKLLQLAVTRRLTAIDEQDFLRGGSGYRPQGGALDAGDKRTLTRQCGRDHWGVEAAIRGVFDHIDPEWMSRMLAERIDDRALWRLIQKWLKAGVLDTDGQVLHPATGTPPGGIISPILVKVYWHYALDLWFETRVKRRGRGEACLSRDADDCVGVFAHQAEADRFYEALGQRLGKCGLERSAEKTRGIPCSRQRPAAKTSFALLGCECRWGQDRAGKDHLGRRTSRKK